ncbi:MAG: Na/Pi cotransporter family protein [Firmicutes bacterium]|nr:Na/Pi cotransporter family protein [Bacillota bacterium]
MEMFRSVLMLFAGVAVFLLGMKLLSGGLQKGAGKSVKKTFARIGDNRFINVGLGTAATVITNSSTATSVMVVGFVNAGVMTLIQATGILLGANVGTTLTAYLAAIGDVPISQIFMASGLVGFIMYVSKKRKLSLIGEIILGLSITFVGMNFMSGAFRNNPTVTNAFETMFYNMSTNPVGPLLLFIVGTILTLITQSSTATSVMIVGMANYGAIPIEAALFVLIGANLGTTVTALIASIGLTANAKRAALIHFFFNFSGVIILLPIVWAFRNQAASLLDIIASPSYSYNYVNGTYIRVENRGLQAAIFHTFFNLTAAIALIGFVKPLAKLSTLIIKDKEGGLKDPELEYINKREDLSPIQASLKETLHMGQLAKDNILLAVNSAINLDNTTKAKITNTEQQINFINKGIGLYLVSLSKEELSQNDQTIVSSLHYVVSDIERIGDHAMSILEETSEMIADKIIFSDKAKEELNQMLEQVELMFDKSLDIFEKRDTNLLDEIADIEQGIDELKEISGFSHVSRLEKGECTVEGGTHFYAIITSLERVADHLMNVAYSIKHTKGPQLEMLKSLSRERIKARTKKSDIYW